MILAIDSMIALPMFSLSCLRMTAVVVKRLDILQLPLCDVLVTNFCSSTFSLMTKNGLVMWFLVLSCVCDSDTLFIINSFKTGYY